MLYRAFLFFWEKVVKKEFFVKMYGLNSFLANFCFDAYTKQTFDPFLESALTSKLNKMKEKIGILSPLGIDIVVDYSGSMKGDPIKNALYITLLLNKLCNIESAVFFSNCAKRVYIQGETWYDSIQSLYRNVSGSTNLASIFSYLENNDNTTLIITDGDCDPNIENNSPFKDALIRFPNRKFIVWNVKVSKLHFPYSITDSRVGYISGNEPSVIESVFKCLSNGVLTPTSLLETCISTIETPFMLEPVEKPLTNCQIQKIFSAIKKNIPIYK